MPPDVQAAFRAISAWANTLDTTPKAAPVAQARIAASVNSSGSSKDPRVDALQAEVDSINAELAKNDGKISHSSLAGNEVDNHPQYAVTQGEFRVLFSATEPEEDEQLFFNAESGSFENRTTTFVKTTGIPVDETGAYLTTLTYNETEQKITLAPTGDSFDIFVQGKKYTFTTPQELTHPATAGGHFFYFELDGTFTYSATPWSLIHDAPVAFVYWSSNNLALPFEERHHAGRDVYWHANQHRNEGTKASTGFAMTGYTLNDGTTDAAVSWALASGRVEDEDIPVDTQSIVDGGPYTLLNRTGAGDWAITRAASLPFFHAANRLQINTLSGTWELSNVTEDYYANYYVFALTCLPQTDITPNPNSPTQIIVVPGQSEFATEQEAHAESVSTLSWGTLPFQEIAPLYQITFRYNANNPLPFSNTARCAITRVIRIVGGAALITSSAQTDHGSLVGLGDDDHLQYAKTIGTNRVSLDSTSPSNGEALVFDSVSGTYKNQSVSIPFGFLLAFSAAHG